MNNFLKLAYEAGAQQALSESNFAKTAKISTLADLFNLNMPDNTVSRSGGFISRNIPRPLLDAEMASRNAQIAARAAEPTSRVAARMAPKSVLFRWLGRMGLGGAAFALGAHPCVIPVASVGGGLYVRDKLQNKLVPDAKPTKMQYLKQFARTPTGRAGLLAALLGGGALGYNALTEED